jgi:uncharacterized OB-fold protein
MKIKKIKKDKNNTDVYKPPPKKHKGLTCKKCGVNSYYIKDKCWLCKTPFNIGEENEN